MKKLPKVGTLVVLKKYSELVNDAADHFNRAVICKAHRTFLVVKRVKQFSNQLTIVSVLDSTLVFTNVDITEVKKL